MREGDDEVLALHQIVENGQNCFLVDVIEEVRFHHVVGVVPYQLLALRLRLFDYLLIQRECQGYNYTIALSQHKCFMSCDQTCLGHLRYS